MAIFLPEMTKFVAKLFLIIRISMKPIVISSKFPRLTIAIFLYVDIKYRRLPRIRHCLNTYYPTFSDRWNRILWIFSPSAPRIYMFFDNPSILRWWLLLARKIVKIKFDRWSQNCLFLSVSSDIDKLNFSPPLKNIKRTRVEPWNFTELCNYIDSKSFCKPITSHFHVSMSLWINDA